MGAGLWRVEVLHIFLLPLLCSCNATTNIVFSLLQIFFLSSIGLVRFVPILSVLHFVVVVFCWHFFYVNTEYNIFNVKYAL